MERIKVYTGYNERHKIHYWQHAEILEAHELPVLGEEWRYGETVTAVTPFPIDAEQDDPGVYEYQYYLIWTEAPEEEPEEGEENKYLVAVPIDLEEIFKEEEEEAEED